MCEEKNKNLQKCGGGEGGGLVKGLALVIVLPRIRKFTNLQRIKVGGGTENIPRLITPVRNSCIINIRRNSRMLTESQWDFPVITSRKNKT